MKDKVIQIGGKSYKECEVIRLPAEKARIVTPACFEKNSPHILMSDIYLKYHKKIKLSFYDKNSNWYYGIDNDYTPQHLYILSSEEIKEGDWFIHPDSPIFENIEEGKRGGIGLESFEIHQVKKIEDNFIFYTGMRSLHKEGIKNGIKGVKKIIATTDSLKIPNIVEWFHGEVEDGKISLPRPSDDFIKAYVKAQGKIDKVLVEYYNLNGQESGQLIKIASDNTITIKPFEEKTSWNKKEELEKQCDDMLRTINKLKDCNVITSYEMKYLNDLEISINQLKT